MTQPSPPPASPYPSTQRDAVARLEEQVRSLRALAFGGVALGLAATALAAFSLARPMQPVTPAAAAAPVATGMGAGTVTPAASAAVTTIGKPADAGAAPSGTIVLGAPGRGLPVLDVYEDFQCPACASVERTFGPQVDALVASGTAEVRYHMMSFLDSNLGNDSSVRAANGGFCADAQHGFLAWHDTLFAAANRPAEEGVGWTDAQLRGFAAQAKLDVTAWSACVASKSKASLVTDANQLSMRAGVTGTPTYKLNGTTLNLTSVVAAGGLQTFVRANS